MGASKAHLRLLVNRAAAEGTPLAFDIETKGNEAHNPESVVVGFALSDAASAAYWTAEHWPTFLELAKETQVQLLAHNATFDLAYALRDGGEWLNLVYCTYFTYKYLATEGFLQQKWGLKGAQTDLLGRTETNEVELDQWLIENGYHTSPKTAESFQSVKEKDKWTWHEESQRYVKANKAEMWRAPASILGHYCALDAYSTARLYWDVFRPALDKFVALDKWLLEYAPFLIRQCIVQQLRGFAVDRDKLQDYLVRREAELAQMEKSFLEREDVAPYVTERYERACKELDAKEPERYLIQRWPKEPKRLRKDGTISKAWENWRERTELMKQDGPVESKNWQKWKAKRDALRPEDTFNIGSGKQLAELLYDCLQYPVNEYTDSGEPATSGNALLQMGEIGLALDKINEVAKELTYVRKALGVSERDGRIHPQFRVPGTLTGRLAGSGGFSLHQMPKVRSFLETFIPDAGNKFVQCDHSSIEPHVLAEGSRCKQHMKLYGPEAKSNCIYIFTGAQIPNFGEPFKALGYDPDNPTKEAITKCKKELKGLRNIAKVLVLSSSYGAGPKKIYESLKIKGVDITFEQAKEIHKGYWDVYADVKRFEKFLLDQWETNKGWYLNGLGAPIGVDGDKTKDIVNRYCQSTAHSIHVMFAKMACDEFDRQGIEWQPIIIDFHDELYVECKEEDTEKVAAILKETYPRLNDLLKGHVIIKGEPEIINSIAESKCED